MADVDAFYIELARLKRAAPGSCGCLIVNTAAEQAPGTHEVQQRIDRYRHALTEAMSAALNRAVDVGEIGPDRTAERADVLAALAVAVNWTARSSGAPAARRLARAARAVTAQWRLA